MSAWHHKNICDEAHLFTLTSRDAACEKLGSRAIRDDMTQPSTAAGVKPNDA